MIRDEALLAMTQGSVIRHYNYSPEEWLFINDENRFQTEDGCTHSLCSEFWTEYQTFPDGWEIVEMNRPETNSHFNQQVNDRFITPLSVNQEIFDIDEIEKEYRPLKRGSYVPIRTEPKIGRNSTCICGSGKKYKKCCGC